MASYIGEGRLDSPLHTLEESVAVVALIEDIRNQIIGA